MVVATLIDLLDVQLTTIAFNIPLNNQLQTLDLDSMTAAELEVARDNFEGTWNLWNRSRTIISILVTVMLLTVLNML